MESGTTALAKTREEFVMEQRQLQRVAESLVLKGDISELSPEERTRFYLSLCDQLGLNPATQPLAILRLNGKEVLYPTRGATDQLAAIHRLNREIIDGPKVVDLAGTKLVYAVCRATHPNGRVETAVATVPLTDPVNVLMKCETKAKRRATLSILGLGMLDETEIESIPSSAKEPAQQVDVRVVETQPTPSVVEKYREALQAMSGASMWDLAFLWLEWSKDLAEVDSEQLHDLQMEAKGAAPDATSMKAWKWACEVVVASSECQQVLESLKVHREGEAAPDFIFSWQAKKAEIAGLKPEHAEMCWELHWRGYGRVTNSRTPRESFKKALSPTEPDGPKGKKTAPQAAPANAESSSAEAAPAAGAQASVSYLVPLTESARFVASADEWSAHCSGYRHREHALASWAKHCAAFRAAGEAIYRARLQTAAERLQTLANAVDAEVCKVSLLNQEKIANNNARRHAEALMRKAG